jgi:hypothetical protein
LGDATIARWLNCPPADQDALLRIAARLQIGENHLRDVLDALEAIGSRRGSSFAEILDGEAVRNVLEAGQARNETLRALKLALRRLRFPQLVAAEARLRSLVRELALPAGVTMTLPENLEGDEVQVTVRASSPAEIRRRLDRAVIALQGNGLEEIYRVLGGEW